MYNRGVGSHRPDSVLHQKWPQVTILKKLMCDAGIISALDHLSRDTTITTLALAEVILNIVV